MSKVKEASSPIIDSILAEMTQEAQTTRKLLERVPGDKLSWRPHPKSYSLGQLALHVARIPGAISGIAILDGMEAPNFQQAEATSVNELLETLDQGIATARENLSGLGDARLHQQWDLKRGEQVVFSIPRIAVLRSLMLNHYYHHRGQLSVYLRLLDVPVPSIYGPSADDNPFA
ncbi:MAG TPA: DinB family protein [Blastocatellia bacterium]|nr:DinB family protein [Blastocatellia bacterium]